MAAAAAGEGARGGRAKGKAPARAGRLARLGARAGGALRLLLAWALAAAALAAFALGALLALAPSQRVLHSGTCDLPDREGYVSRYPWRCGLQRVGTPAEQGGLDCYAWLQPGGWGWSNAGLVSSDAKVDLKGTRETTERRSEAYVIDSLMDYNLTHSMLKGLGYDGLINAFTRHKYEDIGFDERYGMFAPNKGVLFTHGDIDHTMGAPAIELHGGGSRRSTHDYRGVWRSPEFDHPNAWFIPMHASEPVREGPFGKAVESGRPPMNFRALDVGVSVASKVWHRITEPGTETLRPWLRTALRLMPGPLQRGALQGLGAVRALTWFEPFHISTMGMHSKPRGKLFPLEVENGHWLGGQGPRTGGFLKPYTTSAHSAGDTAYIVSECKVAYMGDLLMHTATPIQWHGPASAFIEAIDDVLGMEPTIEYFVPGHGPILDRAGAKEVRAYWKYVRELGKACFRSGMRSEVCAGRALRNLPRPFNAWDNPERMYQNIAVEVAHLEKGVGPNPEGRLLGVLDQGRRAVEESLISPRAPELDADAPEGRSPGGGGPGGHARGPASVLWDNAAALEQAYWQKVLLATEGGEQRCSAKGCSAESQTPDGDEESSDEESSDEESSDEESSDEESSFESIQEKGSAQGESGEEDYDDDDPEDSSEEDSSEEEEDQAETRAATSTG